jgi:hypothetical protein
LKLCSTIRRFSAIDYRRRLDAAGASHKADSMVTWAELLIILRGFSTSRMIR